MSPASEQTYVELKFSPSPDLIPIVRRFVSAFYERVLNHADAASRLALTTHELLENTVKFSLDGISSVHLGVTPLGDVTLVTIRPITRCGERDRENVARIVEEMKQSTDMGDYYQQVMRKNARRRDGSGLGLARIAAEAEMTLECEIEGEELRLIASARLTGEVRLASTSLPEVTTPTFSVSSSVEGDKLRVHFLGNADMAAKDALADLLPRVHAEAQRLGVEEVVVDFTWLEFMTSSCFRSFVTWVSDVQDLPPERQYHIRLVSNAGMLWQRRSLRALKCFADDPDRDPDRREIELNRVD